MVPTKNSPWLSSMATVVYCRWAKPLKNTQQSMMQQIMIMLFMPDRQGFIGSSLLLGFVALYQYRQTANILKSCQDGIPMNHGIIMVVKPCRIHVEVLCKPSVIHFN